jgi:type I site-specific restriction endonuclease
MNFNQKAMNIIFMNEADTRANLIDPKLIIVGWGNVEGSYIRREVNITQGRIITGGKRHWIKDRHGTRNPRSGYLPFWA